MRAVPEAASGPIAATLEAMKLAVGGAETGLCHQRGDVGHRGVAHRGRERTLPHRVHEASGSALKFRKMSRHLPRNGPRIFEPLAIVVAKNCVLVPFWRIPAGPCGRPIRKMPGQQKRVLSYRSGADITFETDGGVRSALAAFGPELAVGAEIMPEEHGTGPPLHVRPTGQTRDLAIARPEQSKGKGTPQRTVLFERRIHHEEPLQSVGVAELVHALVARHAPCWIQTLHAHRVLQREGNGHRSCLASRVANAIAKDRDRKTRALGVQGNERAE